MNIILLGAPGAGKGTQASMVVGKYRICHIATGDILRKAVANGTPLGLMAKAYMDRGELVPDGVVIGIIKERLSERDCTNGFLLDGFPRTIAQADALSDILSELGKKIDVVIDIEVSEEELIRRLTGRRTCKCCGRIYHLIADPPTKKDLCDICGGELYQRSDDAEETVKRRLTVYLNQTAPLIEYYQKKGLLKAIDSQGNPEEIFEKTDSAIKGF